MNNRKLTIMLTAYRKGNLAKREVVEAVSLFVYRFPLKAYRWKEDECSDFFSFFFPKIENIIETFQMRGVPFEAYLIKTLRLQIKTFAAKRIADEIYMKLIKNREFWPYEKIIESSSCLETSESYNRHTSFIISVVEKILSPCGTIECRDKTLKKRALMLVLKKSRVVSPEDIEALSPMLGCSERWLSSSIAILREKLDEKNEKRKIMEERRNRRFLRLCVLHEQFYTCDNCEKRNQLYSDIARTKAYMENLKTRIEQLSDEPTHQEIAEIMNLPKGSVDSGLFYLKLYLDNI